MTTPSPFDIEALRKVFVGGLKRETTVDGMREYFSKYGTIVDIVIISDPNTHVSRGFGYVTFTSSDIVDTALEDKPHVIEGKEVEVKRAIPRDPSSTNNSHHRTTKIFIGGLPKDTTEDDIHKYFSNPDLKVSVTTVEMMTKDGGECRGFCFVSFANEDMVDKLTIIKYHHIKGGKKSEVKKAQPKNSEGGGDRGGRGRGGRGRGSYQGFNYNRGGGAGGGQYGGQSYNNGEYGGGNMGYGGGYNNQGGYNTSYNDGSYGGGYGGDNYQMGYYNQGPSNYGSGQQRGRGRGQRYNPY